ncbi:hypothetical protein [Clostridium gasigenes]|nr:hypothetical protein [Clostridium gasigenes]MBU3107976.1 hypothetical protein [Clostridium gasigenes]
MQKLTKEDVAKLRASIERVKMKVSNKTIEVVKKAGWYKVVNINQK